MLTLRFESLIIHKGGKEEMLKVHIMKPNMKGDYENNFKFKHEWYM